MWTSHISIFGGFTAVTILNKTPRKSYKIIYKEYCIFFDVLSSKQFTNQASEGIVALYVLAQDVNLDLADGSFWFDRPAPNRHEYKQGWS